MNAALVRACTRDGAGGSPTAVLDEGPFTDAERRALPARLGASHAVFAQTRDDGSLSLRFFTAAGELPACGHGTIAALALFAHRHRSGAYRLRAGGREFHGWTEVSAGRIRAAFDPGPVALRDPDPDAARAVLAALGTGADPGGLRVAGVGRERLLVPIGGPAALADLAPDFGRLRAACDAAGLLGCYAYAPLPGTGRFAARMFAPSIGVDEDIANANSTVCLTAHLGAAVEVDMGDALGRPATIAGDLGRRAEGLGLRLGGTAVVDREVAL